MLDPGENTEPAAGEAIAEFDRAPDRSARPGLKWSRYAGRDIIPLWVADMDFRAPPVVRAALAEAVAHGVFGYPTTPPDLAPGIVRYVENHYGWRIDPSWLVWLPNLVTGINLAVRAGSETGAPVATFTPIYPPFLKAPDMQRRALLALPLLADGMRYRIDFAAFDAALAAQPSTRLLLLCHPHNPVGRVWDEDELAQLAEIAIRNDLIVCSDEVHCDLILDPARRHRPFADLHPELAERTITLMSPSKTYNIAGLGAAFAIIANPGLRHHFRVGMAGLVPEINALGWVAMRAALSGEAEDWRRQLLDYLRGNRDRVAAALEAAGLPATTPEATYLTWIDARRFADPHRHFESLGVGLSDGADFGAPGFLRLNFGCSRRLLDRALARLPTQAPTGG